MTTNQCNWAWYIPPQVGVPSLAMAEPGVGKTATAKCIAKQTGREFLPVMLDQSMPEDIGGIPVVTENQGRKVFRKVLDEVMITASDKPSILFFDELTNAPHAVQAAALEWINNPPPDCWVLAAANPVESAANGVGLTPPMANRICIVDFELDMAGFLSALRNDSGETEDIQFSVSNYPIVSDDWRKLRPYWSSLISRFLVANPEFGQKFPSDVDAQGRPWPSIRSWHRTINALAGADTCGASQSTQLKIAGGLVGEAAALGLMEFFRSERLPDAEQVLMDKTWQVPKSAGEALAIIRSVIQSVRNRISQAEAPHLQGLWWEKLIDFSVRVFAQRQEYGMMVYSTGWGMKPKGHQPKARTDDASMAMKAILVPKSQAPALAAVSGGEDNN